MNFTSVPIIILRRKVNDLFMDLIHPGEQCCCAAVFSFTKKIEGQQFLLIFTLQINNPEFHA